MPVLITKKPNLVRNSIPDQVKTAANSLTIHEWNQIINVLKTQANLNTQYLEQLHKLFFTDWDNDSGGLIDALNEFEPHLLSQVLDAIEGIRSDLIAHKYDLENPHQVTAEQIGLTPEYLEGLIHVQPSSPQIKISPDAPTGDEILWAAETGTISD